MCRKKSMEKPLHTLRQTASPGSGSRESSSPGVSNLGMTIFAQKWSTSLKSPGLRITAASLYQRWNKFPEVCGETETISSGSRLKVRPHTTFTECSRGRSASLSKLSALIPRHIRIITFWTVFCTTTMYEPTTRPVIYSATGAGL